MANTNDSRVQAFEDTVHHLSQQNQSLLESRVRTKTGIVGKTAHFERLSPANMIARNVRHSDTQLVDIQHSRRTAFKFDYEWGQLEDEEDSLELIISPTSEYAIAAAAAVGRRIDQTIVNALSGNAASGEQGGTLIALPAAQKETTASGNTLAKMTASLKILHQQSVDVNPAMVTYATNPAGMEDVLNIGATTGAASFSSGDFNSTKPLVPGMVTMYLGMMWVMLTDKNSNVEFGILPEVAAGIVGTYLFHRNALGMAMWRRVSASLDKRADKSNSMQVLVKTHHGAVRVEEALVVENQITV